MVLPEGFALPAPTYVVPVVVVLALVAGLLWHRKPAVTDGVVVATIPWMVAGAGAHVLYQVGDLPEAVVPLFGVPMVYFSLAAATGAAWLLADATVAIGRDRRPATDLGIVGTVLATVVLGRLVGLEFGEGTLAPTWPVIALAATGVITAASWLGLRHWYHSAADTTGIAGLLVVVAHTLDGVTTVIGLDILGGAERSPIVDALIGWWSGLPTADLLGESWPFVLLKVALALALVGLIREPMEEAPSLARLVLIGVAALGLAPGVHNLLLFLVGG